MPVSPPYIQGAEFDQHLFSLLAIVALVLTTVGAGRTRFDWSPATVGFVLLVIGAATSAPFARVPDAAIKGMLLPVGMLALHATTRRVVTDPRRFLIATFVLLVAAAVIASFGVAGFFDFVAARDAGETTEGDRARMLSTPFFEHSYLAVQSILPILLAAVALLLVAPAAVRVAVGLLAAPILFFVAVVLSRTAWVAALLGFATVAGGVLAWRAARKGRVRGAALRVLVGLAATAAVVGLAARLGLLGGEAHKAAARVTSLFDPRMAAFNFSRLVLWQDALRMIAEHLPLGVGPGGFAFEIGRYAEGHRPLPHAHNQWLHTLAELGPIGLLGLGLAFLDPLVRTCRALVRPVGDRAHAYALAAAGGGLVGLLIYTLFESPFQFPTSAIVFAFLTGSVIRLAESDPAAGEAPVGRRPLAVVTVLVLVLAVTVAAVPQAARHMIAGNLGYRATLALGEGDPVAADALTGRALEWCPNHIQVRVIQAAAARRDGDIGRTIELNSELADLYPAMPGIYWDLGMDLLHERRLDEAIDALRIARGRASVQSAPHVTLMYANALAARRRYEPARLVYHELLQRNFQQQEPVVLLRLAETLLNLGRDRGMVTLLLERYIKKAPERDTKYARELLADLDTYYPAWR